MERVFESGEAVKCEDAGQTVETGEIDGADFSTEGTDFAMVAKTLYGLEDVLAEELRAIGAKEVTTGRRMVSFSGDKAMLYKANFHCRTAMRILMPLVEFKAGDADQVYQGVRNIAWDQYFTPKQTFVVDAVVNSESFTHSKFVAYRTKDAIVDFFYDKYEDRPSVRVHNPDYYIHIHISHNDCTVSLDSSGESLHKRGYRVSQVAAPLNEVLAAGMILKTGWRGESDFIDPMCGSGTLLIEAAMIALNIAPGVFRKEFAFERWADFDSDLFEDICSDDSAERTFDYKCYGSDISPDAIRKAMKNVRSTSLMKYIELKIMPFQQYVEAPKPGILVMNPPYGERISSNDLFELYTMIGERLKHVFAGYNAWIIGNKEECLEKIGLRPKHRMKLINGDLECEYLCYELFEGKRKERGDYQTERRMDDTRPTNSYERGQRERGQHERGGFRGERDDHNKRFAEKRLSTRQGNFSKSRVGMLDKGENKFNKERKETVVGRKDFNRGRKSFVKN